MRLIQRHAIAVAVMLIVGTLAQGNAFAATSGTLNRFPVMAELLGIGHQPAMLDPGAAPGFIAKRFVDGYRLETPTSTVVLRPEFAHPAAATDGGDGVSYLQAFSGVDALRYAKGGAHDELFFIDSEAATHLVAYQIFSTRGIAQIVNTGRGVRFVADRGPDVLLSAPLIVDSSGRPSLGAEWTIDRSDRGAIATLRLRVRDQRLNYPIVVAYAVGMRTIPLAHRPIVPNGTGSISGTVTKSGGGAVSGALIYLFDSNGDFVDFASSNGAGAYTIGGLDTGSYRALSFADGYTSLLYNNISCPDFLCSPQSGNAISVTDGASTAGINFVLHPNVAEVDGQVTGPAAATLADVTVVLYNASGVPSGSATTDENGRYAIFSGAGTFYARTFNNTHAGLVDSLYSGMTCVGCNPTSGTAFTTSTGNVTSNINFALTAGGRIAGKLRDGFDSSSVEAANVTIYNAAGVAVSFATSDESGGYLSFRGLTSGTYYALASAAQYAPQLYNGIACFGCGVTTGTPISVVIGSTTSNIDFSLNGSVARVSGRVTDAATTTALGGVTVVFYDVNGSQVVATTSDYETGSYSVLLPGAGRYYARTLNGLQESYINQLYSGKDCSGCSVLSGTPIDVNIGIPVSNINFALHKNGGNITGSILDSANSTIPSAWVQVFSASGDLAAYGYADANGQYAIVDGLTAGTYYLIGRAVGYVSQLYSGIACSSGCSITSGTAVHVTSGQTTTNINFSLSPSTAHIAGQVQVAGSGTPLSGVEVAAFDGNGALIASASTDASGNYSIDLVSGGTFFARTQNSVYPQYHDQLYNHLPCEGCDPTTGTAIHVADGATASGIDFDLTTNTCPTIALSPSSLLNASVNVPYSQTITASAGASPIVFEVSSGSQPPGLGLAQNGVLSGSPNTSGSFTFTVTATDANNCTGAQTYTISVSAAQTTTSLSASPTSAVYGMAITLTASVTPTTASGNVSFNDGANLIATAPLVNGSATISVASLNAANHDLSATYGGSDDFAPSTSPTVQVAIQKATPVIMWSPPASITYPTALSATQLNATANVLGSFIYVPPAGTVLNAGSQTLTANFTPADTNNYNSTSKSVTLVVNQADQAIHWSNPADIVYGTALGPTQLNATVTVPGPSPAGALTYNPSAGTVLDAGNQTLNVTAAATINYNEAHASVTLTVLKATPVFTNLSAPTIVIGTPSTVITGKIAAGALIPPGSVLITLNGVAQMAAIQADGSFTSTFDTSALAPIATGYPVSFSYAESANFNAASGESTLTVVFATTGGPVPPGPANSGSTIPIRVQIFDAAGMNLSAAGLAVTAYGIQAVGSATWLPPQSTGNSTNQFRYQNAAGGSYLYTLKTTGLTSGNYVLGFKVADDPTIHTVSFTIR